MTNKNSALIGILSVFIIASCSNPLSEPSRNKSSTTGWNYNDRKQGGFEVRNYTEQTPGPGLVFIEGGRLTMGRVEEDVMSDWNNISKTVNVSSFYIDETEVRNIDYVEYLEWIKKHYVYSDDLHRTSNVSVMNGVAIYEKALPDTLVWRDRLGENETFINNYLRHPSYRNYPVVGVSWEQANNYCIWRTDRVNERILIDAGLLLEEGEDEGFKKDSRDPNIIFTTSAYIHGDPNVYHTGLVSENQKGRIKNMRVTNENDEGRYTNIADGLLVPNYRLPTEAEWEHAALGYIGNNIMEDGDNHVERKTYPWNGSSLRNQNRKNQGKMMANFKRGRGDNMGISGSLNDGYDITGPVRSYWPNDYGLYNMAGNVSEWVADVYRPVTEQTTTTDHRPFRGSVFKTNKKDPTKNPGENSSIINEQGQIEDTLVSSSDNIYRRNYKKSNNINYLDGDIESQMHENWNTDTSETSDKDKAKVAIDKWNKTRKKYKNDSTISSNSNEMYNYGNTTLISDRTRVYKGGSWKDRAYWLNPGTRRFLDQTQSSDCIGFRCAMDRVGGGQSDLKQNKRREVDYSKTKK